MRSEKRIVMSHAKVKLPSSMDPLQFAYSPNQPTVDAIFLHIALSHMEKRYLCQNAVRRLQFSIYHNHPTESDIQTWSTRTEYIIVHLDFELSYSTASVGSHWQQHLQHHRPGALQGCVLPPWLFTLLAHDCTANNLR